MNIPPRKLSPHTNRPTSPPMLLVHTCNLHFTSDSRPKESQNSNHGIREVGVWIIGGQPDRTGSVGSYFAAFQRAVCVKATVELCQWSRVRIASPQSVELLTGRLDRLGGQAGWDVAGRQVVVVALWGDVVMNCVLFVAVVGGRIGIGGARAGILEWFNMFSELRFRVRFPGVHRFLTLLEMDFFVEGLHHGCCMAFFKYEFIQRFHRKHRMSSRALFHSPTPKPMRFIYAKNLHARRHACDIEP